MITVIHGPPGCGKTRDAKALKTLYGCDRIIDGWQPGDRIFFDRFDHVLLLTNCREDAIRRHFVANDNVTIITFADAAGEMAPLIIEYYDTAHRRSPAERWHWRTRCPKNRKILGRSSEGYSDKAHCLEMIERHFGASAAGRAVEVRI